MKPTELTMSHNLRSAFSLLELLVAMAVLALMMTFMFSLVASTFRSWESGVRQIEAVQAARVGLDRMGFELQFAMSQRAAAMRDAGPIITNVIPFKAVTPAAGSRAPIPGDAGPVTMPFESAQIFAVAPIADPVAAHGPFTEIGYYVAYNTSNGPYAGISPQTYALMWHRPTGSEEPKHDVYYRGLPTTGWYANGDNGAGISGNRWPLLDNCWQMQLEFASNSPSGLVFINQWLPTDELPAGVLVKLSVMDSKTAARIRQLRPGGLESGDIGPNAAGDVARILREGTIEVSRYIPFLNSTN
jgi:prepilin-type N-terminal cleavage/methylation domain-containing protein